MKVLDVIKLTCAYLGLYNDYLNYFEPSVNTNSQETLQGQIALQDIVPNSEEETSTTLEMPSEKKEILSLLILAFNNTQDKILKNINLITQETVTLENGKIDISKLSKKLNKVLKIFCNGKKLNYKVLDNFIVLDNAIDYNNIEIEYSYFLPYIETLNDETNLQNLIKLRTFALGVASEYCFISGLFDDAEIWNKKFLQELNEDRKSIKNFITPKRSWR